MFENANEVGQRSVIVLSTTAGARLYAVWKQKKDSWYIESRNKRNTGNVVVDILNPRQFQDAIEKGYYFFE